MPHPSPLPAPLSVPAPAPVSAPASIIAPPSIVARTERTHLGLAAAAFAVALAVAPASFWSGLLVGVLFGAANFRALAFLTGRMVDADRSSRNAAVGLLLVKFAVLAGGIGAVLTWLEPDGLALLLGLTLAPLSLAVTMAIAPRADGTAKPAPNLAPPAA